MGVSKQQFKFMRKPDIILNSKQRILKIASELFSESGFLGVSMADIAKSLNITKAALYYHFTNKKELYLEVLEKSFRNLIKAVNRVVNKGKSPEQRLCQVIRDYLKLGLKERNLIKSLIVTPAKGDPEIAKYVAKLRKRINRQFQFLLKKILGKKKTVQNVDLKFITSGLLGIMDGLILEAALFNKKLNIKKKASQILQIIKLDVWVKVEKI